MGEQKTKPFEIEGLTIIPDFITEEEEDELMHHIYDKSWDGTLRRRTQQYGWTYNYRDHGVEKTKPLPDWIEFIQDKLQSEGYIDNPMEQLIINEYIPGQGIYWHKDSFVFGEKILSISLGSACLFQLRRYNLLQNIYLRPRTLVIMTGEARYKFQHGIPACKTDIHDGIRIPRGVRISLTFRTIK